jgi:hypothetical protein
MVEAAFLKTKSLDRQTIQALLLAGPAAGALKFQYASFLARACIAFVRRQQLIICILLDCSLGSFLPLGGLTGPRSRGGLLKNFN